MVRLMQPEVDVRKRSIRKRFHHDAIVLRSVDMMRQMTTKELEMFVCSDAVRNYALHLNILENY